MNADPKHQQAELVAARVGITTDQYLSLESCKTEEITITGTSQQSAAIESDNILISCDTACYVTSGTNPTAALPDVCSLVAGVVYPFTIESGHKIAVIGTSGTLSITEAS